MNEIFCRVETAQFSCAPHKYLRRSNDLLFSSWCFAIVTLSSNNVTFYVCK